MKQEEINRDLAAQVDKYDFFYTDTGALHILIDNSDDELVLDSEEVNRLIKFLESIGLINKESNTVTIPYYPPVTEPYKPIEPSPLIPYPGTGTPSEPWRYPIYCSNSKGDSNDNEQCNS